MFPGPGAQIYRNEAGEPIGWDYPSYDPPEPDDDFHAAREDDFREESYERGYESGETDSRRLDEKDPQPGDWHKAMYLSGYDDGWSAGEND